MGRKLSQDKKHSIDILRKWFDAHKRTVTGPQLVSLLEWIQKNMPNLLCEGALHVAAWQAVGTQLRAAVAAGDVAARRHLENWWQNMATLKTIKH